MGVGADTAGCGVSFLHNPVGWPKRWQFPHWDIGEAGINGTTGQLLLKRVTEETPRLPTFCAIDMTMEDEALPALLSAGTSQRGVCASATPGRASRNAAMISVRLSVSSPMVVRTLCTMNWDHQLATWGVSQEIPTLASVSEIRSDFLSRSVTAIFGVVRRRKLPLKVRETCRIRSGAMAFVYG